MPTRNRTSSAQVINGAARRRSRSSRPLIVAGVALLALAALMYVAVLNYVPAQAAAEGHPEVPRPTPQLITEPTPQPTAEPTLPPHVEPRRVTIPQMNVRNGLAPRPNERAPRLNERGISPPRRAPVRSSPARRANPEPTPLPQPTPSPEPTPLSRPTTSSIEVSTQPGGYPIIIDGRPAGETTDYVRAIELDPGPHTVQVQFPNNQPWRQVFNVVAGRRSAIALSYRPRTIEIPAVPVSPCPYNVSVASPARVGDGDIVTFTADVNYQGPSAPNYTWTVSPPAALIMSGAETPTIIVDSSGLGNKRVTAILVVGDGSGDRSCRQTTQATTAVRLPDSTPPGRFNEFRPVPFGDDKAVIPHEAETGGRVAPAQSGGGVQTVDLGDVTGTLCDAGVTSAEPEPTPPRKAARRRPLPPRQLEPVPVVTRRGTATSMAPSPSRPSEMSRSARPHTYRCSSTARPPPASAAARYS